MHQMLLSSGFAEQSGIARPLMNGATRPTCSTRMRASAHLALYDVLAMAVRIGPKAAANAETWRFSSQNH
jgi:hypothetical protein